VIPDHGAYTGAFMDFGDAEDDVTLEMIEDFEQMVESIRRDHRFVELLGRTKFSCQQSQRHLTARLVAGGFLVALGQPVRGRSRPGQIQMYWHERRQKADGSYSNLRVNSSVESLRAYRSGVAHPDWLGDLILRALPKT